MRVSVDRTNPDPAVIRQAVGMLKQGKLVAFPTETVYGLAADPAVPGAVERLFHAKERPPEKAVARFVDSVEMLRSAGVDVSGPAARLAEAFWPGPLTMVLEHQGDWIGFRVPDHSVALALVKEFRGMPAVTSANLSGRPDPLSADDVETSLGKRIDLLLDGGLAFGGVPSTVVRISGERLEVLREGAIGKLRIEQVAGF